MSCLEHTRCLDWKTRNFLRGAQEMFCVEHRNCRVWNRGIVLRGAEEMSCVEHIKCSAWDTGNVVHGHRNSIPWWHHPSITLQVLIRNFENELSQLACSFSTLSPSIHTSTRGRVCTLMPRRVDASTRQRVNALTRRRQTPLIVDPLVAKGEILGTLGDHRLFQSLTTTS